MDLFLYDIGLRHERVKQQSNILRSWSWTAMSWNVLHSERLPHQIEYII